jgi:hypothetical protein
LFRYAAEKFEARWNLLVSAAFSSRRIKMNAEAFEWEFCGNYLKTLMIFLSSGLVECLNPMNCKGLARLRHSHAWRCGGVHEPYSYRFSISIGRRQGRRDFGRF